MASSIEDALSFLDLMDLDEEVIDKRLKVIMVRNSHTNKSLANALLLLQYKQLINHQESTECENDEECSFIASLLGQLNAENIELVCKITKIVLCLNHTSLTNKCEHLLQQILSDILDSDGFMSERSENDLFPETLLKLYICDSILETVNEKISLLFLETPLESILSCTDEKLKNHFLINTVPLLFEKADGYNILDRIWLYLQKLPSDQKYDALKVLSILSELYLPIADEHGKLKIQSDIVLQSTFWEIILFGLNSDDDRCRKIANYLAKRAIDCVTAKKCDVKVVHEGNELFNWDARRERQFKSMWDDFFVLIESLEEKQSNIVLPSLQLFNSLKELNQVWLTCAFNLGLRHDNTQVKKRVIELKILNKIHSESEAKVLLEALNDSCLIDEEIENSLKMFESLRNQDENCLFYIMKAVPTVNWSPILLHNICEVIFSTAIILTKLKFRIEDLLNIVSEILKIPCNNAILRSRVQSRVMQFALHIWIEVRAKEFFYVWSKLLVDKILYPELIGHIGNWLHDANVIEDKDDTLFISLTNSYTDVSVIRAYLKKVHRAPDFVNEIAKKLKAIQEVISRQYCKKTDCLHEFVYLSLFYKQINVLTEDTQITSLEFESVKEMIQEKHDAMIQYILDLVLSDSDLSVEDMGQCITCCKTWLNTHEKDLPELRNLESVCIKILKENDVNLQRKVFAINIVMMLMSNNAKLDNNLEIKDIVYLAKYSAANLCDGNQNIRGRLQNRMYEKSCEMLCCLVRKKVVDIEKHLNDILSFIDNATECGGYGCLKYIIKIMNCLIPTVHSNEKYNLQQFIERMWKETEELKSNSQYATCIEEFVNLITNDVLISSEKYNNVVLFYCEKIIEYGSVSNKPLLFLIKRIGNMHITSQCGQIVFVLHEILLFAPIPRKEQRVLESTLRMLYPKDDKLYSNTNFVDTIESNFTSIIQQEAVNCLLRISNFEVFKSIITFNSMRIDDMFKNKKRYHGSCHHHKVLLLALQHQLMIALLEPRTLEVANVKWSVALMSKLPHQTSVRVCLEWYIALYLRFQKTKITEDSLNEISFKTIPQLSQFQILYSVLKHKIITKNHSKDEYNFVMDYLLSHTMGQSFNTRLHAQYLAYELYKLAEDESKTYDYTMKLIERNFSESSSEKNYIKLKEDFFANTFDIVGSLTPDVVYSLLVVFSREKGYQGPEPLNRLPRVRQIVEYLERGCNNNGLIDCWRKQLCYESTESKLYNDWRNRQTACVQDEEDTETSGNIQKKYIPWRSMSDFNGLDANKKKESPSELIVVASLIDKLPNLGGMARTSEVFGVRSYVVDSIRHLQDKQFQGLSVSAERWVDIQEVRPGKPLKQYLLTMKHQGYSIVAAEQTSGSVPLHAFRFPKKTVLLLGHEKEGVPCDLLPLMDFCVEIQQQGYVRSLNVHVTAAIFVWEYSRQNILLK